MTELHDDVYQDGGQFYLFREGADDWTAWRGRRRTELIADYGDLKDSDCAGAEKLRIRFIREYPEFCAGASRW